MVAANAGASATKSSSLSSNAHMLHNANWANDLLHLSKLIVVYLSFCPDVQGAQRQGTGSLKRPFLGNQDSPVRLEHAISLIHH